MIRRLDYTPYPFLVKKCDLLFDLDPKHTVVEGTTRMERKAGVSSDEALVLDLAEGVTLTSLAIDGRALAAHEYFRQGDLLTIADVPDVFTLETAVVLDPSANQSGEGLYVTDGMFCTQCEADGFRRITPHPDRPDVQAPMTITITADEDKYPVLLSNGNKLREGAEADGKHFVVWDDPAAKSSYLFALVAGKLAVMEDEFVTMSGRTVALRLYSDTEETLAKCAFAMESLKKAMRWDEVAFGREYDLDLYMIVAVSFFNMGAMENRGLNVFNLKYVSGDPETATDPQQIKLEAVVGHEYFHNWSGNLVTVRDWFQLSLKEGFTVFRDQEFSRERWGVAEVIKAVSALRTRQFVEDAGPLAHPIRPDETEEVSNLYTTTVYEKGAEVVRMQKTMLGDEAFRRATDLYFERHFGQPATCDDFVRAMEDAGSVDLTQFRRWYSQAGTPTVRVRKDYDKKTNMLTLYIEQTCPPTLGQPLKEPFHIPLRIGFIDTEDGDDNCPRLESKGDWNGYTEILHITEKFSSFAFSGLPSDPVLSLNRGFSAPVHIDYPYTNDELVFLMNHDWDSFNRWDAGQTLALRGLLSLVDDYLAGAHLHPNVAFTKEFSGLLKSFSNETISPDLCAAMMELPSEQVIANASAVVDATAIHGARESMKRYIGRVYANQLTECYAALDESYTFDPKHVARRRVKNICLSYLGLAPQLSQFVKSDNMTDELAALTELVNTESRRSESKVEALVQGALLGFFEKHKCDRNSIDTWFRVQAQSPVTDVAGIRELMRHPEFSLKVPNRVYAVVDGFTEGNLVQFHDLSGSGYTFLADTIIEIDAFNPQVASGITDPLTEWKRYDPVRQELMKEELLRLKELKLSKGVMEKVEKSLA